MGVSDLEKIGEEMGSGYYGFRKVLLKTLKSYYQHLTEMLILERRPEGVEEGARYLHI